MKLADPAGLLHHHSSEVIQGVEQTEEDGLVGIKILHLLLMTISLRMGWIIPLRMKSNHKMKMKVR